MSRLLNPAARVLISLIFIQGAFGKITGWDGQAAYMALHHLPFIPFLLGAALAIEAGGVICLVTGKWARPAALVMFGYLVVLTVLLHNFWAAPAARAGMMQTEFFKNLAIAGGLLAIAACAPAQKPISPGSSS